MKMRRIVPLLLATAALVALPVPTKAQSLADSAIPSASVSSTTPVRPELAYMRPGQRTKLRNYFFDTVGPYPILGVALAAGINQTDNTPPEWKQGAEGYGKRFGSDFGIAAVSTTTRYALAQAFHEDTLYYRCECKGVFLRLSHATISTLTARRGEDGHRSFSLAALVAPYAGTMTAVYGWFPDRYSAKDAFRMGNYSLLGYVGGNLAREFIYGGPHSLLAHMHRHDRRDAPGSGPHP